MDSMDGTVTLVTGAGSGLGQATARAFAGASGAVACLDIDGQAAECTRASLPKAGQCHLALACDVSDADQVTHTVQSVRDQLGRIDVAVNCAAIDHTYWLEELTIEQFDRVIAINLRGPFLVAKAVWPLMREQGGGHIVNIASTASRRAWPNACAYHASKWGLLGLTHALHAELRPRRIKVSAVIAGGMRTPFLLDRFPDIDPGVLQDPAHVAAAVKFILTQPDETVIPEIMVLPMRETSWP